MTDRYTALTVVLEHDIRDYDAESLINAIRHIRGVLDVTGVVSDNATYLAQVRERIKIRDAVMNAINRID